MSEDFFARTGARAALASGVAELLEYQPVNVASFLAQHFSSSSDDVSHCVAWLRARPASDRRFLETVQRSYDVLTAGSSGGTVTTTATATTDAKRGRGTASGAAPASRSTASVSLAVVPGEVSRLSRRVYLRLLEALTADCAVHVRHRIVDALGHSGSGSDNNNDGGDVSRAEFLRGIQACLLIEGACKSEQVPDIHTWLIVCSPFLTHKELLDVVGELFDAIERYNSDSARSTTVDSEIVLACLETAAIKAATDSDGTSTSVLPHLRDVIRRRTDPQTSVPSDDNAALARPMQLAELEELVVAAVLT
ncbi:hypothetical protein PINS_up016056 [Pythium insidiosum]|nr:hypothetical protein PINS_up016056 [Pythium insidiosum]